MSNPSESAQVQSEERSSLKLTDKLFEVISSVVMGDAGKEDIITMFKGEGVERPNALLRAITRGCPPDAAARIVHRIPQIPFILNGTLYDPKDIERFNGQGLHFVPAANYEYMLAVDDADVMVHWWRLAELAAIESYRYGGYRFEPGPGGSTIHSHPGGDPSPLSEGPVSGIVMSVLFDDAGFSGCSLNLHSSEIGQGGGPTQYANLAHESRGFLGLGDWNDVISSVKVEHGVTVLFEHAYFGALDGGSAVSLFAPANNLALIGWNDRCSSVAINGKL